MKTSLASPLQIAEVPVVGCTGLIGITFCPGKKDAIAGWNRSLDLDLETIQRWGARRVITLIEQHEFDLLQVPDLGRALQQRGMEWHHLPIKDVSIPDALFERVWSVHSEQIHQALSAGQRVLVHCRGGLGRAGLVAALLLVERGATAMQAFSAVRAVRPGAIETMPQEKYVQRCAANHKRSGGY